MTMTPIDPFVAGLLSDEPSLEWFGFVVEEARDGTARVTTTVTAPQVNGHGVAHGGLVFALADQAFAMAANTVLRHAATADALIHYVAPARCGEALTAVARTTYRDDRRALVDVKVVASGRTIALYHGTARMVRRQ